jgi:hypothetical protein
LEQNDLLKAGCPWLPCSKLDQWPLMRVRDCFLWPRAISNSTAALVGNLKPQAAGFEQWVGWNAAKKSHFLSGTTITLQGKLYFPQP